MSSREAFEQVILSNGGMVDRDSSGAYFERDVDISWLAWQAATERAAKVCEEIEVERTNYCMHVYEEGEQYKSAAIAAIREGNE